MVEVAVPEGADNAVCAPLMSFGSMNTVAVPETMPSVPVKVFEPPGRSGVLVMTTADATPFEPMTQLVSGRDIDPAASEHTSLTVL